jgi:hypothetical protein
MRRESHGLSHRLQPSGVGVGMGVGAAAPRPLLRRVVDVAAARLLPPRYPCLEMPRASGAREYVYPYVCV